MGKQVEVLLLEDIERRTGPGRKGDIVSVRIGYARNYLLPYGKAMIATLVSLRLRERLQAERQEQAIAEKAVAEQTAEKLRTVELTTKVKVDPEGHLYGSVTAIDIVHLLEAQGIKLEKRVLQLASPIKRLGSYQITAHLKEGISADFTLHVVTE